MYTNAHEIQCCCENASVYAAAPLLPVLRNSKTGSLILGEEGSSCNCPSSGAATMSWRVIVVCLSECPLRGVPSLILWHFLLTYCTHIAIYLGHNLHDSSHFLQLWGFNEPGYKTRRLLFDPPVLVELS